MVIKRKQTTAEMADGYNQSPAIHQTNSNSVIRFIRDQKPVHYTLKIQHFSSFKDAIGRHETQIFDAEGYKWKLALYPNGDKKRNSSDNISLYVVTAENDILSFTSEVDVIFTFLIYNYHTEKYLTIQDGKIRRFDGIKTEWGFSQLLSLGIFEDPSNGYLVDDECAFGVDIFAMKCNIGKGETFSIIKKPKDNKFTFKFPNISKLDGTTIESFPFPMEGFFCKVRVRKEDRSGNFSLFLVFDSPKEFFSNYQVYAEYEMSVMKQIKPYVHRKRESKYRFETVNYGYGFPNFMSMEELMEPANGFVLADDVVTVQVEINLISTSKKA